MINDHNYPVATSIMRMIKKIKWSSGGSQQNIWGYVAHIDSEEQDFPQIWSSMSKFRKIKEARLSIEKKSKWPPKWSSKSVFLDYIAWN